MPLFLTSLSWFEGLGFRVWGLWLRVFGFGVCGLGFGVRVWGLGLPLFVGPLAGYRLS